jgi:hypothetical protein
MVRVGWKKWTAVHKSFKIAGLAACLWAVIAMSGGHWLALQSFAWVRMTMEFSRQATLGTAISMTFSGKHPCRLCLKVQQGVQREQQQSKKMPWLQTEKMPEALWQVRCLTVPPAPTAAGLHQCIAPEFSSDFSESPPTPPPRA